MLGERLLVSELGRIAFLSGASLVAEMVKNLPAMWKTQVWFLGWEDPLRREMATHSSIKSKPCLFVCLFPAWSSPQKSSHYLRYHPCFCIPLDFHSIPSLKITQLLVLRVWDRSQALFKFSKANQDWNLHSAAALMCLPGSEYTALFYSQSLLILITETSYRVCWLSWKPSHNAKFASDFLEEIKHYRYN